MLSYFSFKVLKFFSLAICFFVISSAFIAIEATARTYYIAPDGDDINGNGTKDSPWETLQKAHDNVSAGETIYCRGGTYNLSLGSKEWYVSWSVSGTVGNPITVAAYPNETPHFLNDSRSGGFISIFNR